MKRIHTRILGPVLGLFLALTPLSGFAEVPHDMAYQGRLTDAVGAPLAGPVNLKVGIFDVLSGGTALYTEDHVGVVLDNNGAFTVRLGTGSLKVGTFNPALFSGVNRYLEVVVDDETLAPRQPLASVPYALVAEVAEDVVVNPASNIGTVIANAQSTADAAAAGHTVDTNTTYTPGFGLLLSGTTFVANQTQMQRRVSSSCPVGQSIRAISTTGGVLCEVDTNTQLTEAQVDGFVADNGYGAEVDVSSNQTRITTIETTGAAVTADASGNLLIGSPAVAGETQTLRVGDAQTSAFIPGIFGVTEEMRS